MYSSPCWPPAAKIVLLLSCEDRRAVGVEGGSVKSSDSECRWAGGKKRRSAPAFYLASQKTHLATRQLGVKFNLNNVRLDSRILIYHQSRSQSPVPLTV